MQAMSEAEQGSPETENIPMPDVDNEESFNEWLDKYIDRSPGGYEDLQHPDGTPYSREEQIEAAKEQFRKLVREIPKDRQYKENLAQGLVDTARSIRRENPLPQD